MGSLLLEKMDDFKPHAELVVMLVIGCKSRQLHKAGIARLCSIQLDSQEYVISDDRADCYDFGVSGTLLI